MQSTADILKNLWTVAGGDPSALNAVKLTGTGATAAVARSRSIPQRR